MRSQKFRLSNNVIRKWRRVSNRHDLEEEEAESQGRRLFYPVSCQPLSCYAVFYLYSIDSLRVIIYEMGHNNLNSP